MPNTLRIAPSGKFSGGRDRRLTRDFPVARPSGMLCMSRFAPYKTVEPSHPDQIEKVKKAGLSLHVKAGFFIIECSSEN